MHAESLTVRLAEPLVKMACERVWEVFGISSAFYLWFELISFHSTKTLRDRLAEIGPPSWSASETCTCMQDLRFLSEFSYDPQRYIPFAITGRLYLLFSK